MLRRLLVLAGGIALLATLPVQARGLAVDELYGRGVHAYYSGRLVEAHELLTASIEGQSNDPRVYYFRGLVYQRLGRPEEARMDFRKGAELEMADANAFYDVSKALERVQGSVRMTIEQYRAAARVEAMRRSAVMRRARYEAVRSQEDRVLRRNVVLTPQPAEEEKPAAKQASTGPAAPPEPAMPEGEPADKNPFDAPAATSTAPKAAPKAPAKAEAPPKESPPAKASEEAEELDPFGGDESAAKEPPAAKEAPAKKQAPAEPAQGGEEVDPFASDTSTAAPSAATAPPAKATGAPPVTKPATGAEPAPAEGASKPPAKPEASKETAEPKASGGASQPTKEAEEETAPFVEEPPAAKK